MLRCAGIHSDGWPGGSGDRKAKTISGGACDQKGLEQHPSLDHLFGLGPQNAQHSAAELLNGSTALR